MIPQKEIPALTLLRNIIEIGAFAVIGAAVLACDDTCKSAKDCSIGEVCQSGKCQKSHEQTSDIDSMPEGNGTDPTAETDTEVFTEKDTEEAPSITCVDPLEDCPPPDQPCQEYTCIDEVCVLKNLDGASCDTDSNDCVSQICADGLCTSIDLTGSSCAGDANDCTLDICVSGECKHMAHRGGETCEDDANPCTKDVCHKGVCGRPLSGSPCGTDPTGCAEQICEEGTCTSYNAANGTACDDGLWCNGTADACRDGTCTPTPGSEPCIELAACANALCAEPTDGASEGSCEAVLLDGVACDDGNHCNGPEMCVSGVCERGSAPCGSTTTSCSLEVCLADEAKCVTEHVMAGTPCSDENTFCSDDEDVCDDEDDVCYKESECQSGACIPGPPSCDG